MYETMTTEKAVLLTRNRARALDRFRRRRPNSRVFCSETLDEEVFGEAVFEAWSVLEGHSKLPAHWSVDGSLVRSSGRSWEEDDVVPVSWQSTGRSV